MKSWCSHLVTAGRHVIVAASLAGCAGDPASLIPADPEAVDPPGVRHASGTSHSGAVHTSSAMATKPESTPEGAPEAAGSPHEPVAGEVVHGTFGDAIAVDLSPKPVVVEPPLRPRKRLDLDQLNSALRGATLGIGWEIASKDQLVELALTLGKPDYIDQTIENLEPSALFLKFLGDASRSACDAVRKRELTLAVGDGALLIEANETQTSATAPVAIDDNLRALLLRFHGRSVAAGAPELEHWRWLYQTAELKLGQPLLAWQAVCVGLINHPDFYTY